MRKKISSDFYYNVDLHVLTLKYFTQQIKARKNILKQNKFEKFIGLFKKPPFYLEDLSILEHYSKYSGINPQDREYIKANQLIVSSQIELIEACLKFNISPRVKWFESYHCYEGLTLNEKWNENLGIFQKETMFKSVIGNSFGQLLESFDFLWWLTQEKYSSIDKNEWLEHITEDMLFQAKENFKEIFLDKKLDSELKIKPTSSKITKI